MFNDFPFFLVYALEPTDFVIATFMILLFVVIAFNAASCGNSLLGTRRHKQNSSKIIISDDLFVRQHDLTVYMGFFFPSFLWKKLFQAFNELEGSEA